MTAANYKIAELGAHFKNFDERTEHWYQMAILAEKSCGAVLVRLGRLPIQKGY